MAGGTALISPSGYFGRQYGTRHHREWTNQTRAHNTLLVDGEGQATFSHEATGTVLYARDDADGVLRGAVDPSDAYEHITVWTRSFELTADTLTVTDHVELDAPRRIDYLLHSLSLPHLTESGMQLERNGWQLNIQLIRGDLMEPEISEHFAVDLNEGEPEAYHVTMPPQYHMRWHTPEKLTHDICVVCKVTVLNTQKG